MQLFTQLYSYVVEKDFVRDLVEWREIFEWSDDYSEKYSAKNNLEAAAQHERLRRVLAYFSVALNRGLLDVELVDDLIALPIISWWEKMKPLYLQSRDRNPLAGNDMEAAYNLLINRRQQEIANLQHAPSTF